MLETLFLYAFFMILSELIRPKPKFEQAKPAGLGDFQFPTATEGRVIPLVWGTVRLKGPNVVWYGDFQQVPIITKQKTGLFSSTKVVTGYKYRLGIQFALCRGTVGKLLRTWIGEDEVFSGTVTHGGTFTINCPNLFGGDKLGSGGIVGTMQLFSGSLTQSPSQYLAGRAVLTTAGAVTVAAGGTGYSVGDILTPVGGTFAAAASIQVATETGGVVTAVQVLDGGRYVATPSNPVATTGGTGTGCTLNLSYSNPFQQVGSTTPAYLGTCYLAPYIQNVYLGNSTSIAPWAFEVQRIPNGLALGSAQFVNTYDANPANVLYELFTDTEWGFGILAADIDTANWTTVANTLFTEGNGFSYVLDRAIEATELLSMLQDQIDGLVFFNQATLKWQIKLARADYDINTVPEITTANRVSLELFSRGAWDETTNEVRIKFVQRTDDYKDTFAPAQDMANVRILQGVSVISEISFPGVKDKTLANAIAWRELRVLSYPLARASVYLDRNFFALNPASVVAFTDSGMGISKLPMRVQKIDYGDMLDGKILVDLIQDVFTAQAGSFAPPPDSGWTPPSDDLLPFDFASVFEAPRGFVTRDPDTGGALLHKVWAGARRKGPEVGFKIVERHAPVTPSGAFTEVGECFQLFLVGQLSTSLAAGSAVPLSSLVISSTPDQQAALESVIEDNSDPSDIGSNLVNILLVDNEFMLASGAQTSGANVQLNGVYRGVLDSVQASHLTGAKVYLLCSGGNLTDTALPATNVVHVKLLPFSATDELPEASATQIAFTMASRILRPIPPSRLSLDATQWASSTSMEANGAGPETFAIDLGITRRDYRAGNEVPPLTTDAASIFSDFPAANSTTHSVQVRNDPAGANTLLFTDSFATAQHDVLRIRILQATDGVIPTSLRFSILANHTDAGVNYDSRYSLVHDFAATCGLTGQFNFTALDTNDVSALYTATVAGTYAFTLSSAFTGGNVQYRLNGGAFTNLITAGNTVGNIAGVLVSDTIEIRHTSTDVGALKQLDMNAAGAGLDGYAILFV